jgi:hypothetical protein
MLLDRGGMIIGCWWSATGPRMWGWPTSSAPAATCFEEKPQQPASDPANASIHVIEPAVPGEITGPAPRDTGFDLLPWRPGRGWGWREAYFRDIATVEAHRRV